MPHPCYLKVMVEGPDISRLATLLGDPGRANMVNALMAGLALTSGELAREAGVTAQTASTHLAKLVDAGLLNVEIQGRHRYYRIANPAVAAAVEALTGLAARLQHLRTRPGPRDVALRSARVCYDHLAGARGVQLYDGLMAAGWLAADATGIVPTARGRHGFISEGIDVAGLARKPRPLCRACLDWSERRPHLAGSLGKAMLELMLARQWLHRMPASRTLTFSPLGIQRFEALLDKIAASDPTPGAARALSDRADTG